MQTLWSAGLGAVGLLGVAPKPTLAALGFASARRGAWSLGLEARADLPVTDERSDVRFRTSGYALSAVPCVHLAFAFACELTSIGWIEGTGTPSGSNSGTSLLFSFGARLGVELALTHSLGLVAEGDALANPWPVRLVAQGHDLWPAPPLAGGFGLGAALHFQ